MCFLAFTGFFRIEELLSVQLKDVIFLDTHIDIVLDKSKCDQHREGHIVPIARLDSMYCPVKVLEKFLRLCNVDNVDVMSINYPKKISLLFLGFSPIKTDKPLIETKG